MKILDIKNIIHEVTFTVHNPALPLLPRRYAKRNSYTSAIRNMNKKLLRSTFTIVKPKPKNYPGAHHQKTG